MPANNQEFKISGPIDVQSVIPKNRETVLRWNGWGYIDSKFVYQKEINEVYFSSSRYPIGNKRLPHLMGYVTEKLDVDVSKIKDGEAILDEKKYPEPCISQENLQSLLNLDVSASTKVMDRVLRAHGQTLHDVYAATKSKLKRIPDVVVWPKNHEQVVKIVEFANEKDVVVIPFGGGTAVSGAVECPTGEQRTIVSLDTSQMNRILWLDRANLVACCESGIIGQDLERELGKLGFTVGHEPDSYEFSSLGGWVATRASGMKKNVYGNIEDIVVHVKMVTPSGVLEKNCRVPRLSCGPDFNHVILGSEGSFGVVTEVVIKIRPLPECQRYGSVIFPDFESGLGCMRAIAEKRCQPASVRLMDNDQFKFGMILKPESSFFDSIMDGVKKFYVTKIKGFDQDKLCVMTLLFEGDQVEVKHNEKQIYGIAGKFGGMPAGETNGKRGYMLTFVIAYIRDLALKVDVVAESFETSVPWDRALTLVTNTKRVVAEECKRWGITHFIVNSRVTQTYDAGCVIYFYLGFNHSRVGDPVRVHQEIETRARDEIVACGGSISHHHGVGKLRKKWYKETVSDVGVKLLVAAKKELDPRNIFATNNFIENDDLRSKL